MKNSNLDVFINKKLAGKLSFENEQFVYTYSNSEDIVSLTMPIRNASWNSKKLHPVFQMNLPEGALKEAIKSHFSKIEHMDELGFLKLIGPYMLGRLKYEKLVSLKEKLSLEEILNNPSENLFDELMKKFAIHSGISGVQPKLLLSAHNKTSMKFEHYIVKSWTKEYPNLALNEYFCMKAIKNANLETPNFHLSNDFSMFIMERFDVKNDETYLGFEDMCVLTARGTDEKYNGSYEEISRVIKDIIPPQNRKNSLKILFKAVVMNHLLKNGDGHLKNYGILYDNDFEDARLTPIYDVVTTTIYLKNDIPALRLGDGKLWWKEKTYKTFAKQSCNLSNKEYTEILSECYNAISKTKIEIDDFICDKKVDLIFLQTLKNCWQDKIQ
ncbi:MAG: type II toxin-antitoxin system HipA family toxin [Arcobacter sp.]|nr:type II toxin-antitoxin system HipA family toxin [Arcobacter sp.]